MRRHEVVAVMLVLAGAAVVGGQTPQATPTPESSLMVDVSVAPYPHGSPVLVPGDRGNTPAFIVEIWVATGIGLKDSPPRMVWGHKRLVAFAGEPASGRYESGGLSVQYRVKVDLEKKTADTSVRVLRGSEFLDSSGTQISLDVPESGVKLAPGR